MSNRKTTLTTADRKKKCSVEFFEEHGVSYDGFRQFLKNHHYTTITQVKLTGELNEMIEDYKNHGNSFLSKYKVTYHSFRGWLEDNYDVTICEVSKDDREPYIAEYLYHRLTREFSKQEIIEVTEIYVDAIESGKTYVELVTNNHVRLIDIIINKDCLDGLISLME